MPTGYSYRSTCNRAEAYRFSERTPAVQFIAWARGRIQEVLAGDKLEYVVELRPWVWAADVEAMP